MLYLPFNVYLDSKRVSILIEAVLPILPMMYLFFTKVTLTKVSPIIWWWFKTPFTLHNLMGYLWCKSGSTLPPQMWDFQTISGVGILKGRSHLVNDIFQFKKTEGTAWTEGSCSSSICSCGDHKRYTLIWRWSEHTDFMALPQTKKIHFRHVWALITNMILY